MKGLYKAAVNHTLPSARVNLERIMAESVGLYHHVPPPEENISVSVEPFQVEDTVPTEDEI